MPRILVVLAFAVLLVGCGKTQEVALPVAKSPAEQQDSPPKAQPVEETSRASNTPEAEDCRRACWNYNEVMFWENVNVESKDLSPAQRATLRAHREVEYKESQEREEEDPGLLNCVTNCQNEASNDQVMCMQQKKTSADLKACLN